MGRFINADGVIDPTSVLGTNLYAYCLNNPVNMSDSDGNMPKWLSGVLNVVGGIGQGFLGAALIAASPTNGGLSALAGGILMINAAGVITQGIGQIVNDATNTTILSEENIIKTGVVSIGSAIAGGTGAQVADVLYDSAIVAASVYAPAKAIKRALQQSGVIGVKVSVNKVYGNAADPFFTTSPKQGLVTSKIQSIQQTGIVDWRELQAFQKPNGYYQLNAGHHLFQALKNMGYDTVTIYLK